MARKVMSFKGKSLKRTGIAIVGAESDPIELPIRTLSISEETQVRIQSNHPIPRKIRPATGKEIEEIKINDPNFNKKAYPMLAVYDTESEEYSDSVELHDKYGEIAKVVKFIDMDCVVDDNGTTIWDDLDLKRGDWLGACMYFGDVMQLKATDFEIILMEVRKLQGDSVFEKIAKIKQLSGKDIFDILEFMDKKEEEEAEALAEEQLKEELKKSTDIEEETKDGGE